MEDNNTPTNVVDERLKLERIIKNDIQTSPLKEGLLKRYLDYDEFVKGLPADKAEQLLEYTNKDVADKLELFKDQYNLQKPYGPGELEDINSILLDWEEPSPIEDAVLADIENWDLDAEGNPIDPRKKPEGMSKFQQELSAQYNYLLTADTPTNIVDDIETKNNLPKGSISKLGAVLDPISEGLEAGLRAAGLGSVAAWWVKAEAANFLAGILRAGEGGLAQAQLGQSAALMGEKDIASQTEENILKTAGNIFAQNMKLSPGMWLETKYAESKLGKGKTPTEQVYSMIKGLGK